MLSFGYNVCSVGNKTRFLMPNPEVALFEEACYCFQVISRQDVGATRETMSTSSFRLPCWKKNDLQSDDEGFLIHFSTSARCLGSSSLSDPS